MTLKTGFDVVGFVTDDVTHIVIQVDGATMRIAKANIASMRRATGATPRPDLPVSLPPSSGDDLVLRAWSETVPAAVRSAFLKKVQPILVSRCGATDCHGSEAASDFHLTALRAHPNAALLNLKESLRHLDLIDPLESPLLARPRSAHAKSGPVFSRAQQSQLNTLVQWADAAVANVPKEVFDALVVEAAQKTLAEKSHQPDDRPAPSNSETFIRTALRYPPQPTSSPAIPQRFEANDPFDPGIFNMMYHADVSTGIFQR